MSIKGEFKRMILKLSSKFTFPLISNIFFPPFYKGGQPKNANFMAMSLESGAAGISFVLLPDEKAEEYNALKSPDFIGKDPLEFALEFGNEDPIKEMVSLAAVNAICQHVMQQANFEAESAVDSLGLLSVSSGDRIGMVGLFAGLVKTIKNAGADLIVIEKNELLVKRFSDLPITLDAEKLRTCNMVLCTSTTILNNSLDEILSFCSPDAFISIIGPTAGYFPDPLFARGVDVVGGRVIKDGTQFLQLLAQGKRWGDATQRTCFQKKTYTALDLDIL